MFKILILLQLLWVCLSSVAFGSAEDSRYWEYGFGLGYVRYEQYPAAGEYSHLFLPFPTFQYRGKILRADDRDGAKAYLWKGENWSVEVSGTGTPPLGSSENSMRKGMEDLPFILALGPQAVYRFDPDTELALGIYPAVFIGSHNTKVSGGFFETKLSHIDEKNIFESVKSYTKYSFTMKSTTSEVQAQYFDVDEKDVTSKRSRFSSKAGFLSAEISVYQSFKKGRTSFYVGANYDYFGWSPNHKSPLHKATDQFNYLVGVTYVLGESERAEVPKGQTSGILNRNLREY